MQAHSFGNWLKTRRKARDLTQAELADRVGCSAAAIRKFEAEERRPSAQIVERLAEILNIPLDERAAFMRFARGDWQAAPTEAVVVDAPWLGSPSGEGYPGAYLATFLFTDIEGSARLWEITPEKMKTALQHHHAILQEAIVSNGGTVFQIVGDAFCAAFPTVLSAVSAAITAQQELQREPWDLPFPIRVRMGIHTGEAERTSNTEYVSNPTLNRVARILSAAHGGQVLLSLATTDLVKESLPANTELRDMGQHSFKHLIHPEHLFQLNIQDLPSEFPPLNTLTHRHNLPIQVTSFIGREKEQSEIVELIAKNRLVTLTGAGGIGKTRLSIEAARKMLSEFPDGTFFVALAPLLADDSKLIAHAIVQALGFVETGNLTAEGQLLDGIGNKRMLLVLDNCEHLIEGVAALASDLLSTCPQIKILATSRESLRIPGEWQYAVPALGIVPEENTPLDLETASSSPMLRLFAERARAVRSDFTLTKENLQPVTSICMKLDGLPLAIELIAARIRLMPPQALLERLSGQFILTADGMRSTTERQKTLNNAIRWSYDLLPPEEQKLFAYLSVFSGGFTLEAVEAMFSQTFTGQSIANLIASLLDKSLLQRALEHQAHGEARYTMLVTIQEYARERLREMGEAAEIRNLHLAYFLNLAQQADREIHGPAQVAWMERLGMELDNFRAALDWSLSSKQTEKLLRLFTALGWNWLVRWSPSEYRSWLDTIRALPDVDNHPMTYAQILNIAVHQEWVAGNFGEARALVEESQAIWLELGIAGERGLAEALYLMGMIPLLEGDYDEAESYFEQSLELYQKYGELWGVAFGKFLLGNVFLWKDEDSSALLWLMQSLDLFDELIDPWGIARVAQRLGELFLKQGSYEKAQIYFERHLRLDEELDFKEGTVMALLNLGNLYRYQRDYERAQQYYEKSLALCEEYSLRIDRGLNLYSLGMLALHRNDYPLARQFFVAYFDATRGLIKEIRTCDFLTSAAAVAGGTNQPERAAKLNGAVQAIYETTDYRIPSFDRAEFDRHIQMARDQLGEVAFEALQAEGRAMTMEQAIAYALEARE